MLADRTSPPPKRHQMRGQRCTGEKGAEKDVGINHQSHASAGFRRPGFSGGGDSFAYQVLHRAGRHIGQLAARLIYALIKHAPFDCVLNKPPFFAPRSASTPR